MSKSSNRLICRNEVFIEGEYVGGFEAFSLQADRRTFGSTAILALPLYSLNYPGSGAAKRRVRKQYNFEFIKPCAQVEVFAWYEGYEKMRVFVGFIEHIADGFPTRLHLADNTMPLRFGEIQKGWNGDATVQDLMREIIPIANAGFKEERAKNGLTRDIPELRYSEDEPNVQATTTSFTMSNFGGRSPYDVCQRLMSELILYGGVNDAFGVFMGAGVMDATRPTTELSTRYNVIDRDIVPVDGRFVDYDVKITGILKSGKHYTATGGLRTSRTGATESTFDKTYGEKIRGYSSLDTVGGLQEFADKMLESLKGERNKGMLRLLLYPKCQVLDIVKYTDTVFEDVSGQYYVLEYDLTCDEKGYYQTLSVTDQIYMI